MQRERILLVEDNSAIHAVVRASLLPVADLTWVSDLAGAKLALEGAPFALVLLDVQLPDGDGFEFCASLRADARFGSLAIVFLTGQSEVAHRVYGLEIGADDYLTKPFAPSELVARVNARLRHLRGNQQSFRVEAFTVDLAGQRATVDADGRAADLNLTPIEFKLLTQFLRNVDTVITREQLIRAVWGESVHVSLHTVDTHISSLRKKIGVHGDRLTAVVRRGYCYTSLAAARAKKRA